METNVLNQGQLQILKILFTYRYGTRELIATSLGVKNSAVLHQRLEVLIKRGYVAKYHKKDYYLQHKPAAYHLLPNGYRVLRSIPGITITEAMIKASYSDYTRSANFVDKHLFIYFSLQALTRLYPYVNHFTARELQGYSAFPQNLTDAYLSYMAGPTRLHFFLNAIPDGTPKKAVEDMVTNYHIYFLQNNWSQTGNMLPMLLVITESAKLQDKISRIIKDQAKTLGMTKPLLYTTTIPTLQAACSDDNAVIT